VVHEHFSVLEGEVEELAFLVEQVLFLISFLVGAWGDEGTGWLCCGKLAWEAGLAAGRDGTTSPTACKTWRILL